MSQTENIHRESVVDPSEYTQIGCFYRGTNDDMHHMYQGEHRHLSSQLGDNWEFEIEYHRNGSGCVHCGASFAYGVVFSGPTGYVAVGHTCAGERFTVNSNLMLRAKLAKQRAQTKSKNDKMKAQFVESLSDGLVAAFECDHHIVRSIFTNGCKYGGITEKQADLVLKLAAEALEPEVEEEELKGAVVEGKHHVEGVIVSARWQDSHYGSVYKMLVEVTTEDGPYRLWGSVPSKLHDVYRGDRVAFNATVTASDDDESFGFFKRPTKPVMVERSEEGAARDAEFA